MKRVPFTYTWIEPGKILAGSIPQLPEDLDTLKAQGIQTILSLTRRFIGEYPDMQKALWDKQIGWIQWPIPDNGIADDKIMLYAAQTIDDNLKNPDTCPIYIHCRGGIGRTGMILLAYYVLHRGMSLADAKEIVKVRRNYEGNASAVDQGSPQKEWIDGLEARRNAS